GGGHISKTVTKYLQTFEPLFNDSRFARNHFEKAKKQSFVLMLTKEFRIFSLNVHLRGMPFAEFEEETRIVVWNPCTGQTKWNQPRYPYRQSDTYSLGPYQDSNCGNTSYKILRHEHTEYRVSLRGKTYWFAGDILSTKEKKVLVCCERWMDIQDATKSNDFVYLAGEDNKITNVDFGASKLWLSFFPLLFSYVPSLVQIQ
ncbi:hypothetical protein HID58_043257, partial [Brassica napus]